MGRLLEHALFFRAPLGMLPLLKPLHVLSEAVAVANRDRRIGNASNPADVNGATLTYPQALVLVASHLQPWVASGDLVERTVQKMVTQMASLSLNMGVGRRQPLVAETTSAQIASWVDSPLGGARRHGKEPAATTRKLRLSAARLFFRVLRQLSVYRGDPTLDIQVPAANGTKNVPLDDVGLLWLRLACIAETGHTRMPAVLALSEASATTDEIAKVRIRDCDLDGQRVFLRGNGHRQPRWAALSSWAARQIKSRIAQLMLRGAGPDTLLIYKGEQGDGSESPGVSAARAMGHLLRLAELTGEPGIRPGSIPAALGRRIWDTHHDIELVALALGCRSLDVAARIICVDLPTETDETEARLRQCLLGEGDQGTYQRGKKPPNRRRPRKPAKPSGSKPGTATARTTAAQHKSQVWQAGK